MLLQDMAGRDWLGFKSGTDTLETNIVRSNKFQRHAISILSMLPTLACVKSMSWRRYYPYVSLTGRLYIVAAAMNAITSRFY